MDPAPSLPVIHWLTDDACQHPELSGGKASALAGLARHAQVPPGFAVVAGADLSVPAVAQEIQHAYHRLVSAPDAAPWVAVRSSAVGEDGAAASFAGQLDTKLGVSGADAVLEAVRAVQASAASARAAFYRQTHQVARGALPAAVLVQRLIPADAAIVAFSLDPMKPDGHTLAIHATLGLGESLVAGSVTPDVFAVRRRDLAVLAAECGGKASMVVPDRRGGTKTVPVPRAVATQFALTPPQVAEVARLVLQLEQVQGHPVDIEAAFWQDALYLLQCRPITAAAVSRGRFGAEDREALS